jgi:hypothetical protein
VRLTKLSNHIEKAAALSVLDLHDPKVWIETDLVCELLLSLRWLNPRVAMEP